MRATSKGRVVGLLLLIGAGGCASSDLPKSAAIPMDALTDSRDLEGASQQSGDYVGTLVLLPCSLQKGADNRMHCVAGTRRPALMIAGDSVVHPLKAAEPAVESKLTAPQLVGKKVLVNGTLFVELKVIFVNDIHLAPS
jgi:hypothetical protein